MNEKSYRVSDILIWASAVVMIVALYLAFVYAPT